MASVPSQYSAPPLGLNYLAALEPCYTFVLISLPLSSILFPILLLILFFSTPRSRKTLIFALNILIVLLGIIEGVLSTIVQSTTILHPQHPVSDPLFLAYVGVAIYTPILVDSVLILRLSAVYPATITPRPTRLAILTVPLLCTAVRIACVTIFVRRWAIIGRESSALTASNVIWPQNAMIITAWCLQLFENMYCSALFLCRLCGHRVFSSRMYRHQSIAARLRAVFYIAVSNFVFPSIISVFQLTYIVHDPSIVHGAIVLMVNNYVNIIGVVFSTIWCSSDAWKGTRNIRSSCNRAAFSQSLMSLSGISPNLNPNTSELRGTQPFAQVYSPTQNHLISPEQPPHSSSNIPQLYDEGDSARKDPNALKLARAWKGKEADESASSWSLITPYGERSNVGGEGKGGQWWNAAGAHPCPPTRPRQKCHHSPPCERRHKSDATRLNGIKPNYVTSNSLASGWQRHRHPQRSRSLSDPPYRDPLSHVQDRNVRDTHVSRSFVEEHHLHLAVDDERRIHS